MEKFLAAANEALNWATNNRPVALAAAAGFIAAAVVVVQFVKPYFARPTPTGFDDPEIKRLRSERGKMNQTLGLGQPREP